MCSSFLDVAMADINWWGYSAYITNYLVWTKDNPFGCTLPRVLLRKKAVGFRNIEIWIWNVLMTNENSILLNNWTKLMTASNSCVWATKQEYITALDGGSKRWCHCYQHCNCFTAYLNITSMFTAILHVWYYSSKETTFTDTFYQYWHCHCHFLPRCSPFTVIFYIFLAM